MGAPRAIELWAFPDSTLNLVVASDEKGREREASFPCALYQLQAMVDGHPLTLESGTCAVRVERCEDRICAEYSGFGVGWRQCVELDPFQEALDRLMLSGTGYVR